MIWITGVVILCLIILLWQMTIIGRPIEWKESLIEQELGRDDYENLSDTDKEIRDTEVRIHELKAERVKLQRLKTLNNRKFKVCGDVVKLRKEIERIGEGGSE